MTRPAKLCAIGRIVYRVQPHLAPPCENDVVNVLTLTAGPKKIKMHLCEHHSAELLADLLEELTADPPSATPC